MTSTAPSPLPARAPFIDRVAKLLGDRWRSGELRGGLAATSTRAGGRTGQRPGRRARSRGERVDGVRVARQRIERA